MLKENERNIFLMDKLILYEKFDYFGKFAKTKIFLFLISLDYI